MPSSARSRLALLTLLGVFLIPILMGSMRGLTHVLTCEEEVRTPFTIGAPPEDAEPDEPDIGGTDIGSAIVIEPGEDEGLCGGLALDMAARPLDDGRVEIELPITNNTDHPWRGTVRLEVGDVSVPVDIEEIPPGGTRTDSVTLRPQGETTELGGSLLIGP